MIKLILKTMPPAVNQSYKSGKGRFYKAEASKSAQDAIRWETKAQYRGKPLTGPVGVEIDLYEPSKRRDIDSGIKSLLDCLTGIVYGDDRQVEELIVHKHTDKEKPRVEITVLSLS